MSYKRKLFQPIIFYLLEPLTNTIGYTIFFLMQKIIRNASFNAAAAAAISSVIYLAFECVYVSDLTRRL